MFADIYSLSEREAKFLLEKSIVDMIHQLSRIEQVTTTFSQTKTIVDGMSVSGIHIDDVQTILNLRNAFRYILNETSDFNLEIAKKINSFVSYNEALVWGELREKNAYISGVKYEPPIPVEEDIVAGIESIMNMDATDTYKGLKYMYRAMRSQIFYDGNKRTAIISANYMFLKKGRGILVIRENDLETWNKMLTEYYETNNDEAIIKWTHEKCIFGNDYR